jgi:hypothetical protein
MQREFFHSVWPQHLNPQASTASKHSTLLTIGFLNVARQCGCSALDHPNGSNNGTVEGRCYFTCQQGHGFIVNEDEYDGSNYVEVMV